ncbi:MAG: hypothetical protein JRH20_21405 [Deltaproteobacteria bacterium]|nr:hypothetical protein [Deltaproteobacteria bacterium]
MAGLASEVFLEIGECTDAHAGTWGKPYLGGDNDTKIDLKMGKASESTFLFKVKSYTQSLTRAGDVSGSMDSFGKAQTGVVSLDIESTAIDLDELVSAFFGKDGHHNLVNWHIHACREYHPSKGKTQETHHWWTLSGSEGYILTLAESGGSAGDMLSMVLSADRMCWTDFDGIKDGKQMMKRSHTKDVRPMPEA